MDYFKADVSNCAISKDEVRMLAELAIHASECHRYNNIDEEFVSVADDFIEFTKGKIVALVNNGRLWKEYKTFAKDTILHDHACQLADDFQTYELRDVVGIFHRLPLGKAIFVAAFTQPDKNRQRFIDQSSEFLRGYKNKAVADRDDAVVIDEILRRRNLT